MNYFECWFSILGQNYDVSINANRVSSSGKLAARLSRSKYKFYEPDELNDMIIAAGIDQTILGSDLGQVGNPSPVDGFRGVINICLDLGYAEEDIRKLISTNAAKLIGLDY